MHCLGDGMRVGGVICRPRIKILHRPSVQDLCEVLAHFYCPTV